MWLVRVDPSSGKEDDWTDLYKGVCPRKSPYTATTTVTDKDKVFANAKNGTKTTYRVYG